MSLHKLTAGDGYVYLIRQVAASDANERGHTSLESYYSAQGETPGVWIGAGLESLGTTGTVTEQQILNLFGLGVHPDADRIEQAEIAGGATVAQASRSTRLGARFHTYQGGPLRERWMTALGIAYGQWNSALGLPEDSKIPEGDRQLVRSDTARALFADIHDRGPIDDRELTAFMVQVSRPESSAVAGYDLTFSPVKSVSTLWAIAPVPVAGLIEAAHHAAVADTFAWVQAEAGYTRLGTNGVAQVPARGLIGAAFVHRDSRAGDPDLHTHIAVSNKVQTLEGLWRALDGRMIHRIAVAASERYNTQLEAELRTHLGLHFTATATATVDGKRAIREIVGVPNVLLERWSTRRAAITTARHDLVAEFLERHGRLPSPVELIALSQQATLDTRPGKHQPRSLAEHRARWRAEAINTLGSPAALDRILAASTRAPVAPGRVVPGPLVEELADRVVEVVSQSRAVWSEHHLVAEAHRQVRYADLDPAGSAKLAGRITAVALSPRRAVRIGIEPDVPVATPKLLTRPDGTSVFRVAKSQLYTTQAVLDAESRIVAAAGTRGGRTMTAQDVQIATLEWSANHHGHQLNTSQTALVDTVAGDDRLVQQVIAPAGTGKTTVMGVIATAWTSSGGTVVGLAPQASAARELATAIPGATTDTLDKLVHDLSTTQGQGRRRWERLTNPTTLVIVDEAGLASTTNLDAAIGFITSRGARVLLVGDDQQRAAPSAGGVLRDIETTHGAATLDEVLRFTDPTEGLATLALRAGDRGAIGYWADHHRIRAVNTDTVADTVYQAWAADQAAGIDSIMIAPTLDLVATLNMRARTDRLTRHPDATTEREVDLGNGEHASAGDLIVTKRNDRRLALGRTDFVRNNDRWTVTTAHPDGSLTATHQTRTLSTTLPAAYVSAGHVRLGYAHTHASIQGMTIGTPHTRPGTAHAVVVDTMTRNDLYPALTRATDGTTAYVITPGTGDAHEVIKPDTLRGRTATEMLALIIERDGQSVSASTEDRESANPFTRLGPAADAYTHALAVAAADALGPAAVDHITAAAEDVIPGVTAQPAWETLHTHLILLALTGQNPITALNQSASSRSVSGAADTAAVVYWRLTRAVAPQPDGPLPWLSAVPTALTHNPRWSAYLSARARIIGQLAGDIADAVGGWIPTSAPTWARPYLTDPDLAIDLAVWRAGHSVPDEDTRPAGATPPTLAAAHRHAQLVNRATAVSGDTISGSHRWAQILTDAGIAIADDPQWPVVASRLSLADRAGANISALLVATATSRQLPAEDPAWSLWWRLVPHLGPLATPPTANRPGRATWNGEVGRRLDSDIATTVLADPLWPAITMVLDAAQRRGVAVPSLIDSAAALLTTTRAALADHDLAATFLIDLARLTDPTPPDPDHQPPDPADGDLERPPDAYEHQVMSPPADLTPSPIDTRRTHESTPGRAETGDLTPGNEWVLEHERLSRIYDALSQADQFFRDKAPASWVPGYLASRSLPAEAGGLAPAGWTTLTNYLRDNGFTDNEIQAAGLAHTSSRGTLIDTFRDRLTLPIHDETGRIVAFVGRRSPTMSDPRTPKYLNSPTTATFTKSRVPYGLNPTAISALRHGADILIVEGPLDALAITAATAEGPLRPIVAIASLGTALTAGQLETLDQVTPLSTRKILLAMDSDQPGRASTLKAHRLLHGAGVTDARCLALFEKDPADELSIRGPTSLISAIESSVPLDDLVVDQIVARWPQRDDWPEPKVHAAKEVAAQLRGLTEDRVARQLRRLKTMLQCESDLLISAMAVGQTGMEDLALPEHPILNEISRKALSIHQAVPPHDGHATAFDQVGSLEMGQSEFEPS